MQPTGHGGPARSFPAFGHRRSSRLWYVGAPNSKNLPPAHTQSRRIHVISKGLSPPPSWIRRRQLLRSRFSSAMDFLASRPEDNQRDHALTLRPGAFGRDKRMVVRLDHIKRLYRSIGFKKSTCAAKPLGDAKSLRKSPNLRLKPLGTLRRAILPARPQGPAVNSARAIRGASLILPRRSGGRPFANSNVDGAQQVPKNSRPQFSTYPPYAPNQGATKPSSFASPGCGGP